jgi:Transposase DDE domain group 1
MEYAVKYVNKEISPWGGMLYIKRYMDKIGLVERISNCLELPQPESNRGYDPQVIIESFMTSIWCGANRFAHTEITRHDAAIGRIFGWKRTPAQDTYKRFFRKFSPSMNQSIQQHFYEWSLNQLPAQHLTIDIDSSVLTRYGTQEGARKGYNPSKRGRNSHHPIIAFIAEQNMVAHMWLRSGDTASATNFTGFINETLAHLKGKNIGLFRMDSGFFQTDILEQLENLGHNYIIAAKFTQPIQKVISLSDGWQHLDSGIELKEIPYQSASWDKARRLIIVRQRVAERPKAGGKNLSLFADQEQYRCYRYSAYVTSLTFEAADVWRIYRMRATAENRIKELKYDFGFDSFNLQGFFATEAALTFAMLAYNLMSLFRRAVLQDNVQNTLSTLRHKVFAVGAFFTKTQGKFILNIAVSKQRRRWFDGLWKLSGPEQEFSIA